MPAAAGLSTIESPRHRAAIVRAPSDAFRMAIVREPQYLPSSDGHNGPMSQNCYTTPGQWWWPSHDSHRTLRDGSFIYCQPDRRGRRGGGRGGGLNGAGRHSDGHVGRIVGKK